MPDRNSLLAWVGVILALLVPGVILLAAGDFGLGTLLVILGVAAGAWARKDLAMPETAPPADELRSYVEHAARRHEFMPVAGFETKLSVPVPLEELYVALRAVADVRAIGDSRFADAEDAEEQLAGSEGALDLDLTEAFREAEKRGRRGIALLGDPGSGKTTHLKRILLWVLKSGPENLGLPREMLPIFMELRNLKDLDGGLAAFLEGEMGNPHLEMPERLGSRLLARGNLLLLFDGLDEVADVSQRERVAQWIEGAVKTHRDCRFMVSSRFAGYGRRQSSASAQGKAGEEGVLLSELFLEVHLRPLDEQQAESFVLNWFRIVETGLSGNSGRARAETRARSLIDRLRQPDFRARRVFELTRNPLLLTNLCLVHRGKRELPRRRVDLYSECVSVLLERWRGERKVFKPLVSAADGRRVLQPVAHWLHREKERRRASAADLAPILEPELAAIGWAGGGAEGFLRRVRDESGLLTGWGKDDYGFMHLGFQEYLTALEIRRLACEDATALRELARHHGDSWWQEVALLLVALEEPSVFDPYIRAVLEQPAVVKAREALNGLIEDAAEVSDGPFVELAERDPGRDEGLWARQLLALQVLERMQSSHLGALRRRLVSHPSPDVQQWLRQQDKVAALHIAITEKGSVELVPIPAGSFWMGSPEGEEGRRESEGPRRKVRLREFEIGRYAVTNEEYGRFLAANPAEPEPEYWGDRKYNQARQPVVGVSWEEASRFAAWAGCELPTEAEWEYAARAKKEAPYLSGSSAEDLDRFGWYDGNSDSRLHPVGEKEPNGWGLHDVLGNVWEWVEDDWHKNYEGAPEDGSAWVEEPRVQRRVLRGGSFVVRPRYLRVACRVDDLPQHRDHYFGFRVVRSRSGGQE